MGKQRAEKGGCHLDIADLFAWIEGLNLIVCPHVATEVEMLQRLRDAAPGRVWLAANLLYRGDDTRRLARQADIARLANIPLIATNDALYHHPARRPLADVVTCIREHTTLDKAGRLLSANAERHLKPAAEMARLFRQYPAALDETLRFLDTCHFSLDQLRPSYPLERREGFATPIDALIAFTEEGAKHRYSQGVPTKIRDFIDYEIRLDTRTELRALFSHRIRHRSLCPFKRHPLPRARLGRQFYRLLLPGYNRSRPDGEQCPIRALHFSPTEQPPDIDVDFEHERREEVIQYIYNTYGRERAALTAVAACYRGRSAIGQVSKVFGLSPNSSASGKDNMGLVE